MSSRHVVLVDAGFLLASVAELFTDGSDRSAPTIDYEGLIDAVVDRTTELSGRELLRVYWYDAATNKVPTIEQRRIGLLPDVKLRLGRLVAGYQKGVDSLIVLDLLRLAAVGNVEVIYLLSGDDDLTEVVREAQAHGVRVVLIGVQTATPRLSEAMTMEADGVESWEWGFWSSFVRVGAGRGAPPERRDAGGFEALHTFGMVGKAFALRWLDEASDNEIDRVQRSRPRIPSDVDARLLWDTSAGRDLSESERVALRDGFWDGVDEDADLDRDFDEDWNPDDEFGDRVDSDGEPSYRDSSDRELSGDRPSASDMATP